MQQMQRWLTITALALVTNCSNYDLLDKLQNPGGAGSKNITYTTNNYIFVSSWVVDGSINPSPYVECAGQTGMARADCACTKAAEFNGRLKYAGHKFYAWLSASGADAICRIQGLANSCGAAVAMPWFNTQGQTVANSLSNFSAPPLQNPVMFSEAGVDMSPNLVWTATTSTGTWAGTGTDCSGWTSSSVSPATNVAGDRTVTPGAWTNSNATMTCNTGQRLYCIAAP